GLFFALDTSNPARGRPRQVGAARHGGIASRPDPGGSLGARPGRTEAGGRSPTTRSVGERSQPDRTSPRAGAADADRYSARLSRSESSWMLESVRLVRNRAPPEGWFQV